MAKKDKATYSDAERFDAEFKKRQSEIINKIAIWSQSEAFRSGTTAVVHAFINNHDELVNFARRLFENGVFTANFKELTKREIEANSHKTLTERLGKWLWLGAGIIATLLGEFLVKKYC